VTGLDPLVDDAALPPPLPTLGDVSPEEFARHAHTLVDWMARYLADPTRWPVLPDVHPGDILAQLPESPPADGEPLRRILDDVERVIVPGLTHWNHPGFFAWFANSSSAPAILGEMLAATLNVNAMLWKSAPAATELELRTVDWLRQLLGVGDGWSGHINDTASISTMLAIAAAREAHPELEIRERGMAGRTDLPARRGYASTLAHSSVDKSVITLGLGQRNLVKIGVDDEYRMRPNLLEAAMRADVAAGHRPIAVVATVGTTGVASIDPVREIAEVCARHGAWLHVDGAYGGMAAVVPEMRPVLDGVEMADSLVVNPHKWLFTPVDCSVLLTRRPEVLVRAFSLVPEYLRTAEQDSVVNLMDYGVQLGRRFRSLKLWMVMRAFGADGLAARLRDQIAMAGEFADMVRAEPGWKVVAPAHFSLVCFRWAPDDIDASERDAINRSIMDRVNASGRVFLSHAVVDGAFTLRLAIGNMRTTREHVAEAWGLLREAAGSAR
jgi:aromatic-L-amino-acid decarboxylase